MSRTAVLAIGAALLAAGSARAADSDLTIRGAGFGHGVGMSQYGALGMAQKGFNYQQILAHYYTGTSLGKAESGQRVRVLLGSAESVRFSGATRAGSRRLRAGKTYAARRTGAGVVLLSPTGRRLATVAGPLSVRSGKAPLVLAGKGSYRGTLTLQPGGPRLDLINSVALDEYVQGVVPLESPSSWPAEALRAQAVAARTYAITTSKGGNGFDHYPDTRSQVYGGASAETATGNAAVAATRGELVTYQGSPVATYFFSTSGGRTEDVENTSLGTRPLPWLKSVADPYDKVSPKHRWGPLRMSLREAGRKLGGLVKGSFRGIEVVARGRSPRVVAADVVGSRGRTRTTGAVLRARLGLLDTWAYFTTISTAEQEPADPTGGAGAARVRRASVRALGGTILGGRGRKAVLEIRTMVGWRRAGSARIRRGGGYRFGLCAKGAYRVRVGKDVGPVVTVR